MAQRGKLIPVPVRLEIRQLRQEKTVRSVAAELGLSKTTVQKYGKRMVQDTGNNHRSTVE